VCGPTSFVESVSGLLTVSRNDSGEVGRRQPDGPPTTDLLQVGLDRGTRVHRDRADQLRRVQLAERVDGEQQQPSRQDERGGQRCDVPADEQFREPHHRDRRDDRTQDDVDRDIRVPLEKDGQRDAGQDSVEPAQAVRISVRSAPRR
jgi:hypothetical protein